MSALVITYYSVLVGGDLDNVLGRSRVWELFGGSDIDMFCP